MCHVSIFQQLFECYSALIKSKTIWAEFSHQLVGGDEGDGRHFVLFLCKTSFGFFTFESCMICDISPTMEALRRHVKHVQRSSCWTKWGLWHRKALSAVSLSGLSRGVHSSQQRWDGDISTPICNLFIEKTLTEITGLTSCVELRLLSEWTEPCTQT